MSLSGAPLEAVAVGQRYCFSPNVVYAGGATVRFTVANLPGWATYDTATGKVVGEPEVGDVGTHSGIQITASDGNAQETLGPFSIEVIASTPGSAELAWVAPTQRTDGTPLLDLAGFNLYWGPAGDALCNSVAITNPSIDSFLIEGLTPASWHFVATAIDAAGIESGFSASVSKTILE